MNCHSKVLLFTGKNQSMKKLFTFYFSLLTLISCTKQKDYSYLNTDRRNCGQLYYISERHLATPLLFNGKWIAYRIDTKPQGQVCGKNKTDFEALTPDTTYSTCSIDKIDSAYKIKIFRY